MNRYKVVGIINLFIGTVQLILSPLFLLFVLPKLNQLYTNFGDTNQFSITNVYLYVAILLLIGVINLILGLKNISTATKKEKYFKLGIVSIIISLLGTSILLKILSFLILGPIYGLNSKF